MNKEAGDGNERTSPKRICWTSSHEMIAKLYPWTLVRLPLLLCIPPPFYLIAGCVAIGH